MNFDYDEDINFEIFNYKKPKGNLAEFKNRFEQKKNSFIINKINYKEGENLISIKGIKLKMEIFIIRPNFVKTVKNGEKNNDFIIQ